MKRFLQLLLVFLLLTGTNEYVLSQTFVGSDACSGCHAPKYNEWVNSGHPYKFSIIENNEPPFYPPEAVNFEDTWITNLGDGTHTWADIAGVIGGYGWKARFVGKDGHLIGTAGSAYSPGVGHNQFNFYGGEDHGWADYHPGDVKIYNYSCFKCHTTGGDTTGTWLAGVEGLGNFTEGGIGCESCHGPGSDHIVSMSADDIDKVYEFAHMDNSMGGLETNGVIQTPNPNGNDVNFLCGTCHNRDYKNPINASGGFIKHHEQWDEFTFTGHMENGMSCLTCHEPHKRTIWDGDGVIAQCATCHAEEVETTNHSGNTTCIDCHMPFAAKSGTKRGESGFVGDVRSHLMKITVKDESMFIEDGSFVRNDDEREASLSLEYTCLGCHNNDPNDNIPDKTLAEALAAAEDMHETTSIFNPKSLAIGLYPNPSNGATSINFNLRNDGLASIKIFNATGQLVYKMEKEYMSGDHVVRWDSESNTGSKIISGYYFVKVTSGNLSSVQKLVLVK
jgi:type IX secretion system substrate protein/cytochrome c554/c'-like protein